MILFIISSPIVKKILFMKFCYIKTVPEYIIFVKRYTRKSIKQHFGHMKLLLLLILRPA